MKDDWDELEKQAGHELYSSCFVNYDGKAWKLTCRHNKVVSVADPAEGDGPGLEKTLPPTHPMYSILMNWKITDKLFENPHQFKLEAVPGEWW